MPKPILLSPPHLGEAELEYVKEAFATNWIAPVGPHIDAFETEFCQAVGSPHAVAVSSGTAALHLALRLLEVGPGDEVLCSTLTFVATANPIVYQGATPVFIDSDRTSWNMDPNLLERALVQRARRGKLPKAVVLVHLYGQSADLDAIGQLCDRYGVPLIEDAAESLGATYRGRATGTVGHLGIFSFNGNKIITTSGGGMLVTADSALARQAKFLATQARDPAPHYQHSHLGYNYRLSNVLAGIGRGQLAVLGERVAARRRNFATYHQALGYLPGITFMPEAAYGTATRWLTCLTVDEEEFGCDRETIRLALEAAHIESRPVWKPLHLQPVFSNCEVVGGAVAADLFRRGLCLPSGSSLRPDELGRVVSHVAHQHQPAWATAIPC
ncbi:aminotransferase class I/II-fold pyridoxal phosphate-dependent enzyme [Nodosilinea sp. FACHB-131]|uniref:DegT/DnrJ/EryC1/StrS family aminotransferase n=1 Tax=Cyanophyceae TaxID=3028117 RepID=UPI001687E74F|nr:aminotransferase class I/II-fold pyridoxal phosphate-dependent enzyme [Nodosilinea sp. FACHB-131]MBD1876689.1 aminotransferase class I/II-fold pyridoxal phosphate-dependent enzyme [Nodosilinea sp. FACHB-131]